MATIQPFLIITKELTKQQHEQLIALVGEEHIARHMPKELKLNADHVDLELAFDDRGHLVVAIDGKIINGQTDLKINSACNTVVNADVNFVLTKKAFGFNEV